MGQGNTLQGAGTLTDSKSSHVSPSEGRYHQVRPNHVYHQVRPNRVCHQVRPNRVCIHVCVYIYVYACTYAGGCLATCICVCVVSCKCMCVCVCMCAYVLVLAGRVFSSAPPLGSTQEVAVSFSPDHPSPWYEDTLHIDVNGQVNKRARAPKK